MLQIKTFTNDGNKNVSGNGNPYLSFNRIFGSAVEGLDSQMLFDPFEKQFDLPATLVKVGNRQCGKKKVVGQKTKLFCSLCGAVFRDNLAGIGS